MNNDIKFFFCYSKRVSEFLSSKGIPHVTVAIEPGTRRHFTLYVQNDLLSTTLNEYKNNKNKLHI